MDAEWLVIGRDEDLGDPLFVDLSSNALFADLSSNALSVFTAEHGAGRWESVPVVETLAALLGQQA